MTQPAVPADESGRSTFASLRHPGMARYFSGLALSMVGTWMQSVALAWLMLHVLGGKGRELGRLSIAQFLPMLVLGAWAGSLGDRFDKRRILLVTQTALGACALVLAFIDFTDRASFGAVYAVAAVSGLANAFDTPVRRGMIGDLVPRELLPNAMSLNTGTITSSRVLGMALGGFVTKWVGTGWCFLFNGISYLAMIVAVLGLRQREHSTRAERDEGGVIAGLSTLWASRRLRVAVLITACVATLLFNYQATFPLLAKEVFGRDADGLGALFATASIGSFVGAMTSARMPKSRLSVFLFANLIAGVFGIAVATAPSYWWCAAATIPMGLGGGLLMSQSSGLLTTGVAPTMRSRALAVQSVVFLGSTPIGGPIVGWVADHHGARWAMALGAISALICAAVGFAALDWVRKQPESSLDSDDPGRYEVPDEAPVGEIA